MAVSLPLARAVAMGSAAPSVVGTFAIVAEGRTFGEWTRKYRLIRHVSQKRLAELVGTSKDTISEIETEKREPQHDMAQRIIAALKAPPEPFLRGLGYPI